MLKISAREVTLQCIVYTHSFEMLRMCILILYLLFENVYTKSACLVPNVYRHLRASGYLYTLLSMCISCQSDKYTHLYTNVGDVYTDVYKIAQHSGSTL